MVWYCLMNGKVIGSSGQLCRNVGYLLAKKMLLPGGSMAIDRGYLLVVMGRSV